MGSHSPHKRMNVIGVIVAALFVCIIVVIAGVGWILFSNTGSTGVAKGTKVEVVIASGSSTASIAETLKEKGVIANPLAFRLKARLAGADGAFKAGTYSLQAGEDIDTLIKELKAGAQEKATTVTIPEGKNIVQIGAILEQETQISADEFVKAARSSAPQYATQYSFLKGAYKDSLEGFLFPDTYQISAQATAQDVIALMLARFDEVYSSLTPSKAQAQAYSDAEITTIASIIEREVSHAQDRPLVSSVINNRLAKNMRLQLCSTVQFLLPTSEINKVRLTNEDIAIESPYNTYINDGLPPGPIANPGKASLEAAMNPAKTEYLYFQVVDSNGTTKFDTTAAGFNKTKAQAKITLGQ